MASKKLNLQLMVGLYDQPDLNKDGEFDPVRGTLTRRTRGEVFEARSQAEYDRLIGAGAAVDPDTAAEEEAARLRTRLTELEDERASTDAQIRALEQAQADAEAEIDPDELTGKDLDSALDERGLSTKGKVEEKRERLRDALTPTPTWV